MWWQAFEQRPARWLSIYFMLQPANNDGVWNEAGAMLTFVIVLADDQTAWFWC